MSLEIVKAQGLVTVQDLGRHGRMHQAVPPGGALVPELLIGANRAARNRDGAAAIEVLGRLVVRAREAIVTSHGSLAVGEELVITSEPRRVAYLALRGGVRGDAALVCAGIGTLIANGMTIASAGEPHVDGEPVTLEDGPVRVIPGPDAFPDGALETLIAAPYRILPASDRVGTRLQGAAIATPGQGASRPMVRGAIEVPPDGQPIVLGPEHPTTGGYPLLGVVASADIGRLLAIRIGGSVRFQYV
jgi:5-oxoprolinase (ATP-hydrolysing) subunit C